MAIDLVVKNIILKEWIVAQADCGEKIPDLIIYEQVSQYSIWIALALAIGGILIEQKISKRILMVFAMLPLAAWGYVQFMVDYSSLKKEIFAITRKQFNQQKAFIVYRIKKLLGIQ